MEKLRKITNRFFNNRGKIKELYISFVGGLFAAIPVAFIFVAVSKDYLVNIAMSIIVLIGFICVYKFGNYLVKKLYSKKEIFSYNVNFTSGLIISSAVGFAITFRENIVKIICVGILTIVFFLIMGYFITKTKRK